jgi:hypothetical protein
MKETIKWFGKTILNVASIIVLIICLCSMDSESLLIPTIGMLASTAWIVYRLHAMEEKEGEM